MVKGLDNNQEDEYPSSRVSFDLPRSVGKRKETLPGSSTCVKNSNVFGSQSRVTSNIKTTKPKQTVGIFSKDSGKKHDNQGVISFETQDYSSFLIDISVFLLKKLMGFSILAN